LFNLKESSVADAGQAAVFLKANVRVALFIPLLKIQHNKTLNSATIPELFLSFFSYFCGCKNLLPVI